MPVVREHEIRVGADDRRYTATLPDSADGEALNSVAIVLRRYATLLHYPLVLRRVWSLMQALWQPWKRR